MNKFLYSSHLSAAMNLSEPITSFQAAFTRCFFSVIPSNLVRSVGNMVSTISGVFIYKYNTRTITNKVFNQFAWLYFG